MADHTSQLDDHRRHAKLVGLYWRQSRAAVSAMTRPQVMEQKMVGRLRAQHVFLRTMLLSAPRANHTKGRLTQHMASVELESGPICTLQPTLLAERKLPVQASQMKVDYASTADHGLECTIST